MKKYIYGSLVLVSLAACWVFFLNPPRMGNDIDSTILAITFRLPDDYEFTEEAPFVLTRQSESPEGTLSGPISERDFNPLISPYKLVFASMPGSPAVILNARLYYCDKKSRMCFQDDFKTRIPIDTRSGSVIPWVWEITPKRTGD